MKLQLRRIGDQLVCALPDEVVARLGWGSGDIVDLSVDENSLKIVRTQTAYDHAMDIAHKAMDEYHDALATLAKS
jgi:putative addiction module antidote